MSSLQDKTSVAVIALVAKYKEGTTQPLSLTTLRNMMYFLQEYYTQDVGLAFELQTYGPED